MTTILFFTLVACMGMLVQSFAGFAGSLLAIPLFALFISPKEAVPAYNIVMIIVDLILVFEARKHIEWSRIMRMSIGGVIGIPAGAYCLAYLPSEYLKLGISIATLTFGLMFLAKVKLSIKENFSTQSGIGLLSGFMGGAISESGPPVVLMGLSCGWDRDVFRCTLLAYFTVLAIAATTSYFFFGMINTGILKLSAIAVIPVLLSAFIGVILKNTVPKEVFQKIILTIVVVVGLMGLAHFFISGK